MREKRTSLLRKGERNWLMSSGDKDKKEKEITSLKKKSLKKEKWEGKSPHVIGCKKKEGEGGRPRIDKGGEGEKEGEKIILGRAD